MFLSLQAPMHRRSTRRLRAGVRAAGAAASPARSRACRWPLRAGLAALGLALLLGGCGGGSLSVRFGEEAGSDLPPRIHIAMDRSSAAAGDLLQISASASDDHGIARVDFLRLDPDGAITRLGSDFGPPWGWTTTMPDALALGGSEVRYWARATDDVGQSTDSAAVSVRQVLR